MERGRNNCIIIPTLGVICGFYILFFLVTDETKLFFIVKLSMYCSSVPSDKKCIDFAIFIRCSISLKHFFNVLLYKNRTRSEREETMVHLNSNLKRSSEK